MTFEDIKKVTLEYFVNNSDEVWNHIRRLPESEFLELQRLAPSLWDEHEVIPESFEQIRKENFTGFQVRIWNGDLAFWLSRDEKWGYRLGIPGKDDPARFTTNLFAWSGAYSWISSFRFPMHVTKVEVLEV